MGGTPGDHGWEAGSVVQDTKHLAPPHFFTRDGALHTRVTMYQKSNNANGYYFSVAIGKQSCFASMLCFRRASLIIVSRDVILHGVFLKCFPPLLVHRDGIVVERMRKCARKIILATVLCTTWFVLRRLRYARVCLYAYVVVLGGASMSMSWQPVNALIFFSE